MDRERWKAIMISTKGPNSNEGLNVITPGACDECFVPDPTLQTDCTVTIAITIAPNIAGNRGDQQYTNKHTIK